MHQIIFIDGFSEYHYASIERALKIAKAHKNMGDLKSALTVLARCKEILEDMKKKTKEDSHGKLNHYDYPVS